MSLNAKRILSTILGLCLSGMGAGFLYLEMSSPPSHTGHVYLFGGFIAVGCFIIAPSVIGSALKQVASSLKDILPSVSIGAKKPGDSE